jgi:hypothetical protein
MLIAQRREIGIAQALAIACRQSGLGSSGGRAHGTGISGYGQVRHEHLRGKDKRIAGRHFPVPAQMGASFDRSQSAPPAAVASTSS